MLLYDPDIAIRFPDYGFQIPDPGDRASRVVRELLESGVVAGTGGGGLSQSTLLEPVTRDDLARVHTADYLDSILSSDPAAALHAVYELFDAHGRPNRYYPDAAILPLPDLVDRARRHVAGTMLALSHVLEHARNDSFCYFLGGGMHHATAHAGRGFCPFNDIVVALRAVRAQGNAKRFWIIDTDAHRGDGTAALCLEDPDAATLSIHMAHGWPLDGPFFEEDGRLHPARIPSDLDIPIPEGGEPHYLPALARGLDMLDAMTRAAWNGAGPDAAIVVAGGDPYEHDELPSASPLRLTLEQLRKRDVLVHSYLAQRSIPQAWIMAGGYGARAHEPVTQFLRYAASHGLT
ncbi:histone deacetylase [Oceanidesulfovibrio indonesiensis]|uniref:Histone deacetylase n=1 Tax=Oceanidesulfovibrio indonesiensis TaxID=54767 RepID=A0A7M3MAP1_9BACT|nr:histone deacetylase [Oceanidesulfovibrio indonesiensis]TVM14838.1 histone deacetylase [Oceanidesulfovibrio indonesiensis]